MAQKLAEGLIVLAASYENDGCPIQALHCYHALVNQVLPPDVEVKARLNLARLMLQHTFNVKEACNHLLRAVSAGGSQPSSSVMGLQPTCAKAGRGQRPANIKCRGRRHGTRRATPCLPPLPLAQKPLYHHPATTPLQQSLSRSLIGCYCLKYEVADRLAAAQQLLGDEAGELATYAAASELWQAAQGSGEW